MRLGLSGTAGFGRSGTLGTDYRERLVSAKPQKSSRNRAPSNSANRFESFGFLLTAYAAVDGAAPLPASARNQRTTDLHRAPTGVSPIPGASR